MTDEVQCLLCGQVAETYVDLCDACNQAFWAAAERVADRMLKDQR